MNISLPPAASFNWSNCTGAADHLKEINNHRAIKCSSVLSCEDCCGGVLETVLVSATGKLFHHSRHTLIMQKLNTDKIGIMLKYELLISYLSFITINKKVNRNFKWPFRIS